MYSQHRINLEIFQENTELFIILYFDAQIIEIKFSGYKTH